VRGIASNLGIGSGNSVQCRRIAGTHAPSIAFQK
jgi:hypothetical protein